MDHIGSCCFSYVDRYGLHHMAMVIAGLLFFIAFVDITPKYQHDLNLRSSLMVGFFLGGLVIHGSFQGWWIEPVLSSLGETPLLLTATFLTAFNDNAMITYLASLVPNFTDSLKYAVVAGAVAGGGMTIIANAPNPAGAALLQRYFDQSIISPAKLALGATLPTLIVVIVFLFL